MGDLGEAEVVVASQVTMAAVVVVVVVATVAATVVVMAVAASKEQETEMFKSVSVGLHLLLTDCFVAKCKYYHASLIGYKSMSNTAKCDYKALRYYKR